MTRRKRRMKAARIETDRDRLALEVVRLRGQNLALMLELADLRKRVESGPARVASSPSNSMPERSYAKVSRARHVARVEMRNAAARYGRLANRRTRTHADQDDFDRAKRELDEAAQAFVDAEQLLARAELQVAREAGLASSTSHGDRT